MKVTAANGSGGGEPERPPIRDGSGNPGLPLGHEAPVSRARNDEPIRRPDLAELETFLLAARHGSFARAAAELVISKTAVAKRIGALETLVGRAVFDRGPRGVTLTDEGRRLVPRAERLLAEADRVLERVGELRRGDDPLRIAGARGVVGARPTSTERVLSDTEMLFAKVFHSVSDGIVILRPEDGYVYEANDAAVRDAETERLEVIGRTVTELGVVSQATYQRLLGAVRRDGEVTGYDLEITTLGGSRRHISVTAGIITVGGEERFLVTGLNVTEAVLREARLRKRAAQHEALAALSLAALQGEATRSICAQTAELLVSHLHASVACVWERSVDDEELVLVAAHGATAAVGTTVRLSARSGAHARAALRDRAFVVGDMTRDRRFHGSPLLPFGMRSAAAHAIGSLDRPCGLLAAYSPDVDRFDEADLHFVRSVANILGLMIERDRRLETHAQREHQLANFTLLTEASRNPIALTTLDGELVYINAAGRELLGLRAETDVRALTVSDVFDSATVLRLRDRVVPGLRRAGAWKGSLTLTRSDSTTRVKVRAEVILVADPATGEPRWVASVLDACV